MKTVCVQIGNSDNKLTQAEWSAFYFEVDRAITFHTHEISNAIHFSAPSVGWERWQNAAWIFLCEEEQIKALQSRLTAIRKACRQDSIAWLEGESKFI